MRRIRRRWGLGIVLFLTVTASVLIAHKINHDQDAWQRSKENDVRETVLLYQMAFFYQSHVYFVKTGTFGEKRGTPSVAFMRRFQKCVPQVLPSPGVWPTAVDAHGQYSYQGKTAALVTVGKVHWNFDGSADVDGDAQCGDLCGTYGIFHVVCHHDDWYVTDYEQRVAI